MPMQTTPLKTKAYPTFLGMGLLLRSFLLTILLILLPIVPSRAQTPLLVDQLKDMSLEDILQVEIVSKKSEKPINAAGIVSVVTEDDIKRYGANNLADVLNRVTSLYMLSTYIWSNSTASVRGDALTHVNNHTLVLINGRPFRDSAYGGLNETMFRNFPIHHIAQIEVIRGPGSVLYGTNAFTSVINIVTKKNQATGATVRGRYGSYNNGQFESELAYKNDELAVTSAVRQHSSSGWLSTAVDEQQQPAQYRNNADDISASLWAKWKNFDINLFVADNAHNHWGAVPIGSGQAIENRRLFFDAGYQHTFADHWRSTFNLTFNKFSQNYNLPVQGQLYMTDLHEDNLLFEQTHFFDLFDDRVNVVLGGLVEWQSGEVTQEHQPNTLSPYTNMKSSIYGELGYNLLDDLRLTVGGKWHHFDIMSDPAEGLADSNNAIEGKVGRAGLVYQLTPKLGAKLLYSQAFRSPSAGELGANSSVVLGNRNIQPELIESADAQLFYHARNYQVALTVFRSRMSNLIIRSPIPNTSPTRLQYINGGSAEFEGIEFESNIKLTPNLALKGAYTFQTNRDENQNYNKTLLPNHMTKMGLSYDVTSSWQISAFDSYFSDAKVLPSSLMVNPNARSYHNLSVNTNYRLDNWLGLSLGEHVTLSLYLDNLLDEKFYYPEFNRKILNTIPATPGRMLFGEIAVEF